MAKDYAALPYNQVRRTDREVEEEVWFKDFLARATFGSLATVYEGQPFITPLLFVYDEATHAIYVHTANVGRTRANIEADGRACFNASRMGRLLPADEALEFSNEYESVTAFGRVVVIEDDEGQRQALQLLLDKYAPHLRPGRDYRPITDGELVRTSVYRFAIESWSGKKKEVEADFPGAYLFPEGLPPNAKEERA
jgi:nitroimidazol reductase NimA-like FMN-containing flavoprotein (pyridoxamine 5'-phosphate oxidase superfamily)